MLFEQVGHTGRREITDRGHIFHTEFMFQVVLHIFTSLLYALVQALKILPGTVFPGSNNNFFEAIVLQVALVGTGTVIQRQQLPEQSFHAYEALWIGRP